MLLKNQQNKYPQVLIVYVRKLQFLNNSIVQATVKNESIVGIDILENTPESGENTK
jgi:hypothetical protein